MKGGGILWPFVEALSGQQEFRSIQAAAANAAAAAAAPQQEVR